MYWCSFCRAHALKWIRLFTFRKSSTFVIRFSTTSHEKSRTIYGTNKFNYRQIVNKFKKSTRLRLATRVLPIRSRPQLHDIYRRLHVKDAVRKLPSSSCNSGLRAQRPLAEAEADHPGEHLRQLEQLLVAERIFRSDLHRPDVVTVENFFGKVALESPSGESDPVESSKRFDVLQ